MMHVETWLEPSYRLEQGGRRGPSWSRAGERAKVVGCDPHVNPVWPPRDLAWRTSQTSRSTSTRDVWPSRWTRSVACASTCHIGQGVHRTLILGRCGGLDGLPY
eukprot:1176612-Prymnesium_polylepis.1